MIDALLRAAGLRTGRFSSPHLSDARERISIDGEPISEERFAEVWGEIEPFVRMVDERKLDGIDMTFFEVITGMAYAAFADAPVDVAVVEVGLGGSWDATSVAAPQVSVVAPIGLDHTHILGDSLEKVASEKAGIIKPGATAVLAGQEPAAARVLAETASGKRTGGIVEASGPEEMTLWELVQRTSKPGGVLPVPVFLPTGFGRAFRRGALLPDPGVEEVGPRLEDWSNRAVPS